MFLTSQAFCCPPVQREHDPRLDTLDKGDEGAPMSAAISIKKTQVSNVDHSHMIR